MADYYVSDANGEPIRIGDVVMFKKTGGRDGKTTGIVTSISIERVGTYLVVGGRKNRVNANKAIKCTLDSTGEFIARRFEQLGITEISYEDVLEFARDVSRVAIIEEALRAESEQALGAQQEQQDYELVPIEEVR